MITFARHLNFAENQRGLASLWDCFCRFEPKLIQKGMNTEILSFVTFCIGAVALRLGLHRNEVYDKLKRSGILDGYIVSCYDVLHTFSYNYIVDDIIDFMKKKGVL